MLERLLQATAITLLLSLLTGIGSPKSSSNLGISEFRAFSLPIVNLQLHATFVQLGEVD